MIRPDVRGYEELREALEKFREEFLQEGVDYVSIGGGKPALTKAGAEKVLALFGLQARAVLDREAMVEDHENGYFFYRFSCEVYKLNAEGEPVVLAEGYGSANTKERPSWAKNPYAAANSALKIAKKRAFVDAILSFAGLSDFFTQDEEAIEQEEAELATEKQKEYLLQLIGRLYSAGILDKEGEAKLTEELAHLTRPQASAWIDAFKKLAEFPLVMDEALKLGIISEEKYQRALEKACQFWRELEPSVAASKLLERLNRLREKVEKARAEKAKEEAEAEKNPEEAFGEKELTLEEELDLLERLVDENFEEDEDE